MSTLTVSSNEVWIDNGTPWLICGCAVNIICWYIIAHCLLLRCYCCWIATIRTTIICNFIWICIVTAVIDILLVILIINITFKYVTHYNYVATDHYLMAFVYQIPNCQELHHPEHASVHDEISLHLLPFLFASLTFCQI